MRVLKMCVRSTVFVDSYDKSTCKFARFRGCDGDDDDDEYDDGGDGDGVRWDGVGSDDRLQRWS